MDGERNANKNILGCYSVAGPALFHWMALFPGTQKGIGRVVPIPFYFTLSKKFSV